jgi:hypothetical protein
VPWRFIASCLARFHFLFSTTCAAATPLSKSSVAMRFVLLDKLGQIRAGDGQAQVIATYSNRRREKSNTGAVSTVHGYRDVPRRITTVDIASTVGSHQPKICRSSTLRLSVLRSACAPSTRCLFQPKTVKARDAVVSVSALPKLVAAKSTGKGNRQSAVR